MERNMNAQNESFTRAKNFILSSARHLERLVFSVLYQGNSKDRVLDAVKSYRNPDSGLGHALEPDLRCSESQPIFVEAGLSILHECGVRDAEFANALCGYLASAADANGFVRPITISALDSPHAGHWTESSFASGLNPTIGICGLLHFQGASHTWLEKATGACTEAFCDDPPDEAHTLLGATRLADHHPDKAVREKLFDIIADVLPHSKFFIPQAPVATYGLTPLHFALNPESKWRKLFTDEQIDGHLDDLAGRQQEDGGWPISWNPPGPAAVSEWRGLWTLDAVKVLAAYGRMETHK